MKIHGWLSIMECGTADPLGRSCHTSDRLPLRPDVNAGGGSVCTLAHAEGDHPRLAAGLSGAAVWPSGQTNEDRDTNKEWLQSQRRRRCSFGHIAGRAGAKYAIPADQGEDAPAGEFMKSIESVSEALPTAPASRCPLTPPFSRSRMQISRRRTGREASRRWS